MPRGDNAGRKTLLTPERHEAIIRDLKTGLYATQVAIKNGICRQTLQHWVARGLEEDAKEPFKSFAQDYILADIAVEEETLRRIKAGGDTFLEERDSKGSVLRRGDWKAYAWYAEKRWPKRYGSAALLRTDGGDDLQLPQLQQAAQSRPTDLRELLLEPPSELEDVLLDPEVRESLLRRLGSG